MKETESEKMSVRVQVSNKDEEVCGLRENIKKLEQVLQDSEKEWLVVLDREKLEKSLLTEQLQSCENQRRVKDVEVNALKQDLNCLQGRLDEASAALRQGSHQLSVKEVEAASAQFQLQQVLASMQKEEKLKQGLQQTVTTVEEDLRRLLSGESVDDRITNEPPSCSERSTLKDIIRLIQAEILAVRSELAETSSQLQKAQIGLKEGTINHQHILQLQETKECLQAKLDADAEKLKEAFEKYSSVHSELRAKEEHISCMTLQVSQQKELLAALSQQLKEKDTSIAQIIKGAASERIKLEEENRSLLGRLESVEQLNHTSVQQLSQQLDEHASHSQREMERKNAETTQLMKEKEDFQSQLAKVSKDKEVIKKKLHAALLVRKDLLKRIDECEKQKEEGQEARAASQMLEEKLFALEKGVLQKEEEMFESKQLMEQLMLEKQSALNEKESMIVRLQSSLDTALAENACLQQRLEELQKEITTCKEQLAIRSSCALTCADLENELDQIKLQKGSLQKKAQAAMLARKEMTKKAQENEKKLVQEFTDLKNDFKSLLEQHCQQTNELNTLQLNLNEKVKELEELRESFPFQQEEQDALRQLDEEKDQGLSVSGLQTQLEGVLAQCQSGCLDVERKEKALKGKESAPHIVRSDLDKCLAEIQNKTEGIDECESLKFAHLKELLHKKTIIEEQLSRCPGQGEEDTGAFLEQRDQLKVEVNAALGSVSQKSAEVLGLQGLLAEAQKQLSEELERMRLKGTETQAKIEYLLQKNKDSVQLISKLRHEVFTLREAENRNIQQPEKSADEQCPSCKKKQDHPKERDVTLSASRAQVLEKEQRISELEQQLQQVAKAEKRKVEEEGIQKSEANDTRENDMENQNKMTLLAKKLQAALLSRKELLQENVRLNGKLETLCAKEAKCLEPESVVSKLRQQNRDLENSMAALKSERDKLSTEVRFVLNENLSLSAACDSLKLTIESITQQKQAFSCQLESLKDSQTEELSRWKSKHADLKQEYDSLQQNYQNLSAEVEALEKRDREVEEENQRTNERSSLEKRQRIEDLEEENWQLTVINGDHKATISELQDKNQELEMELYQFRESSAELGRKVAEMEAKNDQLNKSLKESRCLLDEKSSESDMYARNMQFKLDEAVSLNNSLTKQGAQVEINKLLQKEKQHFLGKIEIIQSDYKLQLSEKDRTIKDLKDIIDGHRQETISLNEKVCILEDDKSLLLEELENTQEISDKVKNENKYLETVILKNSEKIDKLTENVSMLQTQNSQISAELAAMKETCEQVRKEKERQQLKLVQEFEEKIKNVQRGSEGSKSLTRDLQELLKDKHQEINQLQHNCIRYQELVLDMERALKHSQSAQELLEKDLKRSSDQMVILQHRAATAESELNMKKKLLREADGNIKDMLSESSQLVPGASQPTQTDKDPNSYLESQLQNQIETLEALKEKESKLQLQHTEKTSAVANTQQLQIQAQHDTVQEELEFFQKEQASKDRRELEAKLKSMQNQDNKSLLEKEQMGAKVTALKNSMSALQRSSERLVSENGMLLAKAQRGGYDGRNGSAEGDPSNGLKHEIWKLLHQMDDLNSENAMLKAQLVRYREDLNQVLSLKDNQVKVLLKKQLDVIRTLEQQKIEAEMQHREAQLELHKEDEVGRALQTENSRLKAQVVKLETDLQALKEQLSVIDDARLIADLQASVAAKAGQCNNLQQQLSLQKGLTEELQDKAQLLQEEVLRKQAERKSQLSTLGCEAGLVRTERETADRRVAALSKELLHLKQQLLEAQGQNKEAKAQNQNLCKAMAALQNDRDQLIQDFKILRNCYEEELRDTRAAFNKAELRLNDVSSDLAALTKGRDILAHKLKALESKDAPRELGRLLDEVSKALSEKEGELKRALLENAAISRQLSAFSKSMVSLQNDRDRLIDKLHWARRAMELREGSSPAAGLTTNVKKDTADPVQRGGYADLEAGRRQEQEVHQQVSSSQENPADLRSDAERRRDLQVQGGEERMQLHQDLQRCIYEAHQRDQYLQQLSIKLQQALEEKATVSAQLRAVCQTLRDTQNHCQRLENQIQGRAQSPVDVEVAPGAPQESSNHPLLSESSEASQLRDRLQEVLQSLADERGRRESAEEALRLHQDRLKSAGASLSRDAQRDFSVEVEAEDEWEALSINASQPLIAQKVTGGMVACRRWIRGRSLYFSRLLTSRARSRYFFLAYLLTIHLLVLMCLTGAL